MNRPFYRDNKKIAAVNYRCNGDIRQNITACEKGKPFSASAVGRCFFIGSLIEKAALKWYNEATS